MPRSLNRTSISHTLTLKFPSGSRPHLQWCSTSGVKKTITTIILANTSFSSTFFPLFGRRKSFEYLIIYDRAGCLPVNMTYTFVKTVIFISAVFVLQCLADVCTLLWSMKAYTQNYLRVLLTVSLTHSISSMLLWKTISSFVLLCGYLGFVSFIFNLLRVAGLLEFVG